MLPLIAQSLQELILEINSFPVNSNNKFEVTTIWIDNEGNELSNQEEFIIKGEGSKFTLFLNKLKTLFS